MPNSQGVSGEVVWNLPWLLFGSQTIKASPVVIRLQLLNGSDSVNDILRCSLLDYP